MTFEKFDSLRRSELEALLGADASKLLPELERSVRLYGDPRRHEREIKLFRAELVRLRVQVAGLATALKGSSSYFRHVVGGVPETLRALDALGSDVATVLSYYQKAPHRPSDRQWKLMRRHVGYLMRAAGIRLTTAPPRGHHPRSARLWRVLSILSLAARQREINSRDVEDVVRYVQPHPGALSGVVVNAATIEHARALRSAPRPQ